MTTCSAARSARSAPNSTAWATWACGSTATTTSTTASAAPSSAAELGAAEAVVEVVVAVDPHAHVAQAVELGADLADLAAEQVVMKHALILPGRPTGRGAGDRQAE